MLISLLPRSEREDVVRVSSTAAADSTLLQYQEFHEPVLSERNDQAGGNDVK